MSELSLAKFLPEARNFVTKAQSLADKLKHRKVEPLHFLMVAINSPEINKLFDSVNSSIKDIKALTETHICEIKSDSKDESYLSDQMVEFLKRAEVKAGKNNVTMEHLVSSISEEDEGSVMKIMQALGLSLTNQKNGSPSKDPKKEISPYLTNLTDLAKSNKLGPVIGRSIEVRRMIQILGRKDKNHSLLIGEVGVGKKSIINSLAIKISSGNVSSKFSSVDIVSLDAGRLVAGIKQRGEIEERVKKALSTIVRPENTILAVYGIESLFGQNAANTGSGDLISLLLSRDGFRVIASITPDGLKKLVEKDVALTRQFAHINVEPSTEAETIEILRGIVTKYEAYHDVQIGSPAIFSAVKLAKRYLQKTALPESAISLLDEASSRKKFEVDGVSAKSDAILSRYYSLNSQLAGLVGDKDVLSLKSKNLIENELMDIEPEIDDILATVRSNKMNAGTKECILTEEDIAAVLEDWTGIPTSKVLEGEADKLGKMEDVISSRVIGQSEAVNAISKAVRRSRLGLRDLGKPIGSFLFLGSSGVGKTEIAKALAKFLFDSEKSMIRIDMSEMGQPHMIQRLIGAPPGYAQADEGGMLTEAVMKNPYSVILLDEIEKAHPDVFNILLQILDDGRLTDGRGRTADFTNTVVIMTSNIGSKKLLELPSSAFSTPESIKEVSDGLQTDLREYLRPEVLNRISQIVIFNPLSKHMLNKIADIQIKAVEKMLVDREIKIKISEEAKEFLIDDEFLPQYGARPLKRAIEKHVQDVLAEKIMAGSIKDGSTVNITFSSGKLYFQES